MKAQFKELFSELNQEESPEIAVFLYKVLEKEISHRVDNQNRLKSLKDIHIKYKMKKGELNRDYISIYFSSPIQQSPEDIYIDIRFYKDSSPEVISRIERLYGDYQTYSDFTLQLVFEFAHYFSQIRISMERDKYKAKLSRSDVPTRTVYTKGSNIRKHISPGALPGMSGKPVYNDLQALLSA